MSEKSIPTLFVMVGPPGAGKSTYANRIYRYKGWGVEVLSRDDIRQRFGAYDLTKERYVVAAIAAMTKAHLLNGTDVVVDANHCAVYQRAHTLRWVDDLWSWHRTRVRKVLVWCPVTYEESMERKGKKLGAAVIKKQHAAFTEPATTEGAHVAIVNAVDSRVSPLFELQQTPFEVIDLRKGHDNAK